MTENWEPKRGMYVWVEGKLTEAQPEGFPSKLRVYIHGVGTGIAKNVRPVIEEDNELKNPHMGTSSTAQPPGRRAMPQETPSSREQYHEAIQRLKLREDRDGKEGK